MSEAPEKTEETLEEDEQAVLDFIGILKSQWRKFFESERQETQWNDMMIDELRSFPRLVLEEAARSLIRNRRQDHFPKLAQCLSACIEAKRFLEPKHPELKSDDQKEAEAKDRAGNFWSLAWEVMRTQPMAKQAAREGWVQPLFWFLVREGRLPDTEGANWKDKGEVRKLKAGAQEFDDYYPLVQRQDNPLGLLPGVRSEAIAWSDAILKRRADLAAYVLDRKPMPAVRGARYETRLPDGGA